MFSSNPCSQNPSSTNVFSPNSFFDYENNNLHFNHHQQIDAATLKQDFVLHHQFSDEDLLESVVSNCNKKVATSKDDGHSKIYTARGPRDRRVRLSIDISRKFFCLQDLLGFDKASKTLDWLLTNSLTAIKDLVEQTTHSSSSTVTDESNAKFLESIKGDTDERNCHKKKSLLKSVEYGKGKKTMQSFKLGYQENSVREQLRADARARARERTKQKNLVKRVNDCESGQIVQQIGYAVNDSSFQVRSFYEKLEDHAVNDSDLEYVLNTW